MIGPNDNEPKQAPRPAGNPQQGQRKPAQPDQPVQQGSQQAPPQQARPQQGQPARPPALGQQRPPGQQAPAAAAAATAAPQAKPAAGQKKPSGKFPRWLIIILRVLRFFLVPALCLAALFIGLTIGYSTIGGESAGDVFKIDTWKHLYDLVFEGT